MLPFKQAYCGGGVTPNSIHIFRLRKIWIPFKRLFKLRRMCEKALQVRCLRPARQWKDDIFPSLRRRSHTPPSPLASPSSHLSTLRSRRSLRRFAPAPDPCGVGGVPAGRGLRPPQPRLAAQIIKKAAPSDCFHFRYSIFPLRNDSIFFSLRET